jgi:adhesin/invasin
MAAGAVADYTLAVLDGTNQPLVGLPVTVTFNGGTPATQQVTTGANGQATVRVTATTAGSAQISASASGIDAASRTVQILGTDAPLRISAPADNAVVDVNTSQTIRLLLKPNGVARAGVPVTVTATRGTFNSTPQSFATATTDANGEAIVSIASAAVGPSAVSATAVVDGTQLNTSSRVSFVSRVAAKIALSPDVSSLSVNAAGSTSSSTRARSPGSAGSKAGLGWWASRYRAMALESAITSEPSTNTGTWRWPDSRNKASWPKPGVTSTTV